MPRVAPVLAVALAVPLLAVAVPALPAAAAARTAPASASVTVVPSGSEESPDESYDTGRAECIGLLPQPDCGRPPEKSGDRGGWAQFVLFGIIVIAIAGIFTYVGRTVLRSDRRRAAAIGDSAWASGPGDDPPAD